MDDIHCHRCEELTPEPGRAVPLLAVPLLFLFGRVAVPWRRRGYCDLCARYASSLVVFICLGAVVIAIIVRYCLLR